MAKAGIIMVLFGTEGWLVFFTSELIGGNVWALLASLAIYFVILLAGKVPFQITLVFLAIAALYFTAMFLPGLGAFLLITVIAVGDAIWESRRTINRGDFG